MNWWEEAESRALRAKTPAVVGQALWQQLCEAGIDPDLAFTPAYDLATLQAICLDLVRLVESVLLVADGDTAGIRRQGLRLVRWAEQASYWTEVTRGGFNQLLDGLDLEPEVLAEREEADLDAGADQPEEEAKVEGRFRYWHLLYERLDLKFASVEMEEEVHRGLARSLARIYEHCLSTLQVINQLEKDPRPRFGRMAQRLLEINTVWHFDLGPYHLGHGQLRPQGGGVLGVRGWLMRAFLD